MIIEKAIADAIDFFHMDALSAAVPMKVEVDIQPTLMASALWRILGIRAGNGMEVAKARAIFRNLVRTSAGIEIADSEVVVSLGRRACNPLLIAAGYGEAREPMPWLGGKTPRLRFLQAETFT